MAKDIKVTLELDNSQFKKTISQSEQQVKSFEKSGSSSLFNIRNAFLAIGGGAVIRSIAQTGASFQDLQNSLNVVFGSLDEGAAAFERVQDFAATTQFSVQTLTQAFVQLKGAGVEPTEDLLKTFADTASVTTDQMGTFQAALDLVSRSTAGGLGLEDLNRLQDRGIPVFQILNEKIGVQRKELSKLGSTAEGANKIIRNLLAGLNERFGGALESQVGLLNFELNQLGDAFDNLQVALFGKVSDAAAGTVKALTDAVNGLAGALSDSNSILNQLLPFVKGLAFILGGLFVVSKNVANIFIFLFDKVRALLGGFGLLNNSVSKTVFNLGTLKLIFELLKKGIVGLGIRGLTAAVIAGTGAFSLYAAGAAAIVFGIVQLAKAFKNLIFGTEDTTEAIKNNAHVLEFEAEQAKLNAEEAAKNEKQKKLNALAEESFQKGLRGATKAIVEQTEAFDKNDPLSSYMEFLSGILGNANKLAVEQVFAAQAIERVNELFDAGLISTRAYKIALEELFGIVGVDPFTDFEDSLEGVTLTTEEFAEKQRLLNALIQKYPELTEAAARAQDTLNDALADNEGLTEFLNTLGKAQKTLSMDLAKSLTEGKDAAESFKNFFKQLVNQLIADAIRLAIIQPILSSIFGIEFGAGGSVTGLTGGGLLGMIPGLANGGPVMANKPFIVGERGPELFVPTASGDIIPNNRMGMGSTEVNYTINAVDAPSFQALVASDPEFIYNVTRVGARRLPGAR